jgi:hypothetical protein
MMLDPYTMSLAEWADSVAYLTSRFGIVERLDDTEQWRQWSDRLVGIQQIAAYNPPSHTGFQDWQSWAAEFAIAVPLML